MRIKTAVFGVVLGAFAVGVEAADYLVNEPGRWTPLRFVADPYAVSTYGASGAEVKAVEHELRTLDAMIRRAPPVANPIGFSAKTWGYLTSYAQIAPSQPKGANLPPGTGLGFGAFPIRQYQRNGKMIREDGGETELMKFFINDIQPGALGARDRPSEWGNDVRTDAFMQPAETGSFLGFPRYGNFIVAKKRSAPIWLPIALEEALSLELAAKKKNAAYLKEVRGSAVNIAKAEAAVVAAEKHLAGVSKEDRAAPACWATGFNIPQRIQVVGKTSECQPLVRPNWAFFDRSLPRSAPQVLLISDVGRCFDGPKWTAPGGCPVNLKLLESIGRQALLDWLH